MTTSQVPSGDERDSRDGRLETRLNATLLSGDRLYPITVVSLTENGFAAEGVALEGLDEECLLEMTLPPIGDAAWSPKAVAMRGAVSRVRARARLESIAPHDAGTSACKGLTARFAEMSDGCRSTLRGWLARLVGARRPITRGCAPRLPE